jgi:UDP-2-acetamido-2,6-beta-L-arabino-hexul-4-ose reductase
MNIVVTGAKGFIGRNLITWLNRQHGCRLFQYDPRNTDGDRCQALAEADLVYHLAGVNRPQAEREFQTGNVDFTSLVCDELLRLGRRVPVVLSSSTQAALDNPYGVSKRKAEDVVSRYAQQGGARAVIYRLHNVFGKWCRPNYNSVVATFCYNTAHDLPVTISDPALEVEFVYIDDVVTQLLTELPREKATAAQDGTSDRQVAAYRQVTPTYKVTLGQLAELIRSFRQCRQSLRVPDCSDEFVRKLYGTYLSYLEPSDFAYDLEQKRDARGSLAEFIKSAQAGQIFLSRTVPGITRGNHYHHTKAEKFLVVEGEAVVRFRHIEDGHIIEYPVSGRDFRVVDIPPGYTHSIENVGTGELVTLFWACEVFDIAKPDTNAMPVIVAQRQA